MPRCSLSSAKIVQGESKDASLLAIFAEPHPIFCKDSANWANKVKFTCNLCRTAAYLLTKIVQGERRDASSLAIFAEPQPILCKDSARWAQRCKFTCNLCWTAAYLMQRYNNKLSWYEKWFHFSLITPFIQQIRTWEMRHWYTIFAYIQIRTLAFRLCGVAYLPCKM